MGYLVSLGGRYPIMGYLVLAGGWCSITIKGCRVRSSGSPNVRECMYLLDDVSPISEKECDHETGSRNSTCSGTDDSPEFVNTEGYVLSRILLVSYTARSRSDDLPC